MGRKAVETLPIQGQLWPRGQLPAEKGRLGTGRPGSVEGGAPPWRLCVLRVGERRCGWKERVSHSGRESDDDDERLVHPARPGLLDCGWICRQL